MYIECALMIARKSLSLRRKGKWQRAHHAVQDKSPRGMLHEPKGSTCTLFLSVRLVASGKW